MKRLPGRRFVAIAVGVAQLLLRAGKAFMQHEGLDRAAVIGYYTLLSVFPLLLGVAAILGLLLLPVREQAMATATRLLPGAGEAVAAAITAVVSDSGALGLVSIVSLLWLSQAVFSAIRRGLNAVWQVPAGRILHRQLLTDIVLVAASIGLLAGSILGASLYSLTVRLGAQVGVDGLVQAVAAFAIPPVVGFGIFALLYRFVPNVPLTLGDVWPGALVATLLFEASRVLFILYVGTFANYASVYGPLASVAALLVWAWVAGVVLLFGAEVASQHYQQRARRAIP